MIELSITIKDENSRLTEKEILYASINLDPEDRILREIIQKTLAKFQADPSAEAPDIIIKTTMILPSQYFTENSQKVS